MYLKIGQPMNMYLGEGLPWHTYTGTIPASSSIFPEYFLLLPLIFPTHVNNNNNSNNNTNNNINNGQI